MVSRGSIFIGLAILQSSCTECRTMQLPFIVNVMCINCSISQDPAELNPQLISPHFKSLFAIWPKFITDKINGIDIGSRYVSVPYIISDL